MANTVLPIVRLFIPCDSATIDLEDGKWVLKNPWYAVEMPPGLDANEGHRQDSMSLYAQITGGVGRYFFTVHLVSEDGKRRYRSRPIARDYTGGIGLHEEVFELLGVPFARPGIYDFQLYANHVPLEGGSATVRVLQGDSL